LVEKMAIEDLIKEIEEKGRLEIEIIRKDTQEKVSRIISDANEKARRIIEEGKTSFSKQLEYEKRKAISTVNMEMKMQYSRILNEIIDRSVEGVIGKLSLLRNTKDYSDYIIRSIKKGKDLLGDDSVIIISEKDRDLVKTEKKVMFSQGLEPLGGVIIESPDGRKRADYSISTLINERMLWIKQEIYDRIKGEL
jgi:vacuolar-type H+-ATPase subunit E/Vma4